MEADLLALQEALGRPPVRAPIPITRSGAWAAVRASLQRTLGQHGVYTRVRSPAVLWEVLQGGRPPPGATWGQLTEGRGLHTLVSALRGCPVRGQGIRLACWNIRWLIDGKGGWDHLNGKRFDVGLRQTVWLRCRKLIGMQLMLRCGHTRFLAPR